LSNVTSLFDLVEINFKDFINSLKTCQEVGWWVGFGCGWAKLNVLQIVSARAWLCSSFNFAKRGYLVCPFSRYFFLVVSSFSMTANVFGLGVRAGFQGTKLSTQH
jgi:hypothetical protein